MTKPVGGEGPQNKPPKINEPPKGNMQGRDIEPQKQSVGWLYWILQIITLGRYSPQAHTPKGSKVQNASPKIQEQAERTAAAMVTSSPLAPAQANPVFDRGEKATLQLQMKQMDAQLRGENSPHEKLDQWAHGMRIEGYDKSATLPQKRKAVLDKIAEKRGQLPQDNSLRSQDREKLNMLEKDVNNTAPEEGIKPKSAFTAANAANAYLKLEYAKQKQSNPDLTKKEFLQKNARGANNKAENWLREQGIDPSGRVGLMLTSKQSTDGFWKD